MSQQADIQFKESYIKQCASHMVSFLEDSDNKCEFIPSQENIIVLVNSEKDKTIDDVRMTAGDVARQVAKRSISNVTVDETQLTEAYSEFDKNQVITAFVEGWELGSYQFTTYKSKNQQKKATLQIKSKPEVKEEINLGHIRAKAVAFSRDLMNEAPQTLTPETFPKRLQEEFQETDVKVIIHDQEKIKEMEMNGLLAVNRGSKHKAAFVELYYEGNPEKPLTALVGKGVTFDTGGISLKSGRDLSDMRMDMGGAAAVAGAMKLLAETKADVNVIALLQIVENMPDKNSLLPGEVIRYKNGHTVQVGNTDAEGRLILADGLIRAGELKAQYIVDIATLTGAIHAALGSKIAGVFGDEELSQVIKEIGDTNGDFIWPMPLIDAYDSYLKSDYADFSNISNKGEAGAITAALFLRKFVPEHAKWLHLDMAGVMESNEAGYYAKAATGFGARLLADFASEVANK